MKIQYASDLHLEFAENSEYLQKNKLLPAADILILAGDITYLREDFYEHPFFDYVSRNWQQVYWIPGNHEFYWGTDMELYDFSVPINIRKNVFLVNNQTLKIDDVHFIFSTLWSEISPQNAPIIEKNVADFHAIILNGNKLTAKNFNQLHKNALSYIKAECKRLSVEKKAIVTHHLPSVQCNALEFAGSKINSAFCTDLTDYISKSTAAIWIYGHSHRNMPEIEIGKTRLVTNQLGYVSYGENLGFRHDKVIEI